MGSLKRHSLFWLPGSFSDRKEALRVCRNAVPGLHCGLWRRVTGCILLLLTASVSQMCSAQPFVHVDLELDGHSYLRRDEAGELVTRTRKWTASAIIGPTTWRIEHDLPRNATNVYYFDGTNVFFEAMIYAVPPSGSRYARPTLAQVQESDIVLVTAGAHPRGEAGVNLIWLAFCSGGYLKEPGRLLPIPGAELRSDVRAFGVEDKTETFDGPPSLPRQIDFFISEENLRRAESSDLVNRSSTGRTPTWGVSETNRMLKARYTVAQVTNFLGWTIPLGFEYVQYRQGVPQISVFGRVVRIEEAGEPVAILEESKAYVVHDTRFRHPTRTLDSIYYTNTGAVLPATNDPTLVARFETLAERRPLHRDSSLPDSRSSFVSLLLILLLSPLIWWGLSLRRTARNRKK